MDQADTRPPKKRYRKPELREYGDLRRVTEGILGAGGKHDGAFAGKIQLKTAG